MRWQEKDHHLASLIAGLCVVRSPANPIRLEFAKRRLDGQTSRSSLNRGRVHPGPPGETTGAWAPSFPGGVKGDWPTGQPLGRATGGPFHRVAQKLQVGGLYLPLVLLSCLVINSVDCRSTEYIYIYTCIYIQMYTHICIYIYVHVCMYVCTYVRIYVCMFVCMSVCLYGC